MSLFTSGLEYCGWRLIFRPFLDPRVFCCERGLQFGKQLKGVRCAPGGSADPHPPPCWPGKLSSLVVVPCENLNRTRTQEDEKGAAWSPSPGAGEGLWKQQRPCGSIPISASKHFMFLIFFARWRFQSLSSLLELMLWEHSAHSESELRSFGGKLGAEDRRLRSWAVWISRVVFPC